MFTVVDGFLAGLCLGLVGILVVLRTTNWRLDRICKTHEEVLEGYQELIRKERNK